MTTALDQHKQTRIDHQARIAACREHRAQLHNWERGYLASLDIWLRREPVLNSIQLGTLHEIHQRASADQRASA